MGFFFSFLLRKHSETSEMNSYQHVVNLVLSLLPHLKFHWSILKQISNTPLFFNV